MKIKRLLVIILLFIILYVIGLTIIPFIAWLFGGSFLEVIQHPGYVLIISFFLCFGISFLLSECIDGETYKFKD